MRRHHDERFSHLRQLFHLCLHLQVGQRYACRPRLSGPLLHWRDVFFFSFRVFPSFPISGSAVTDFAYGTNFAGLALILFLCGQVYTARNIIVLVFLILWGLRLALYLFARVLKEGKDARFDDTRDHFFKFMAFWILQCVTVWTISIPFVFLFSRAVMPSLGW